MPSGTIPLRVAGGVDSLHIERPSAAEIRLHLVRGSSRISLDGVRLGSAGGGTTWESPDYTSVQDRYDLEMGSGVSGLTMSRADINPALASLPGFRVNLPAGSRISLRKNIPTWQPSPVISPTWTRIGASISDCRFCWMV